MPTHPQGAPNRTPPPDQGRDQDPTALARYTGPTIAHYNQQAEPFRASTWDHDVSQNYATLLDALTGPPPHRILDLGCGPGRDLCHFRALGHDPVGLDGSAAFVAMAREASGCTVLHQDFLALALPEGHFDGIFANASLFHVPRPALPEVLGKLRASLKPQGLLFSSNPRGENQESFHGGRYGCYYDLPAWQALLTAAGFVELVHYYRPPGLPRPQQPWLASLWRRD